MSEHPSTGDSGYANAESEPAASWKGNGARRADASGSESAVATDGPADEPATTAEAGEEAATPTVPDDGSAFVSELVGAMQTIVGAERVRIAEESERRRKAQLDLIGTRDSSEVARLRQAAADDTAAVKTWVDVETKRIQREGARRQKEVRDDLEANLASHRATFDGAIQAVEAAVSTYRADVEVYFSSLDGKTDLVEIARLATLRPVFPALDPVPETIAPSSGDTAAQASAAETPLAGAETSGGTDAGATDPGATDSGAVGVMEPRAEAGPDTEPAEAPVAVGSATTPGNSGSLFRTVPALRPLSSWLRQEPTEDASKGDR